MKVKNFIKRLIRCDVIAVYDPYNSKSELYAYSNVHDMTTLMSEYGERHINYMAVDITCECHTKVTLTLNLQGL